MFTVGLCQWTFVLFKWVLHSHTSLWKCKTCFKQVKCTCPWILDDLRSVSNWWDRHTPIYTGPLGWYKWRKVSINWHCLSTASFLWIYIHIICIVKISGVIARSALLIDKNWLKPSSNLMNNFQGKKCKIEFCPL